MSDPYSEAWLQAAKDLNIRVTAPFTLDGLEGATTYVALVHDFGSPTGAVVAALDQDQSAAESHGRWCSWLGSTYAHYDRADWEAMLNDWGWFGSDDDVPDWYTGGHW